MENNGRTYIRKEKIFLFDNGDNSITVVLRNPISRYLTEDERKDMMLSARMMNTNYVGEYDWKLPMSLYIEQVLKLYFTVRNIDYFDEEKYCIVHVELTDIE